jgi:hypothetical protein
MVHVGTFGNPSGPQVLFGYGASVRSVPQSGLLARTLGDLTSALVADGAGRGRMPSVPMWFGLLRAIPLKSAVAQRGMPVHTRLSKRAVRQLVGAARRSGWVEVRGGPGVQAELGLTGSGRKAASGWAAMAEATAYRWSERVGADPGDLRGVLAGLVAQLDLEFPHYPISYGSADFSVTGGRFQAGQVGPPRVPAHGQDWVPVRREVGDTVSTLTVTALLSQLLVAFMVDYAEAGGGALVVAEGLVRGFGVKDALPMNEVPPSLVSMAAVGPGSSATAWCRSAPT